MVYRGFCDKQNKDYSVKIIAINPSATEDFQARFISGRFKCEFSSLTNCCPNGAKDCSIIKNLNR